jgi:Na+/citrate or Na+/malate symporter
LINRVWNRWKEWATAVWQNAKFRKRLVAALVVFVVLQVYFVRELIAAELLFGLIFAILFVLGVLFYIIGAIGERGLGWAEAALRFFAGAARRGYAVVEDLSKKPIRHPHSESAP